MIKLIPFTENHFPLLKNWLNCTSPEFLLKWGGVTFEFPITDEQLKQYIQKANFPGSPDFIFTVEDLNSGRAIGHIALRKTDYYHRSARLGKVLIGETASRNKGFTPYILHELLRFAFEELLLHRVSLGVFDNNLHAKKIYSKYGFKTEGYFRDYRRIGDNYWGMYEMSILDKEWHQINEELLVNNEKFSNK
ncbi:GNAT family N-acetyltransferase [Salipaludibacillus sp. CUR1]|uniref:GNAT family N-acetyltransferase n=1 Tax=Salipaludibacillus sp. CUR1 TaxID=2820003 RepID=UPI001E5BF799|nr:GNAT family protein [Salipaludibacillus sp. CUR1]MCE7793658.1 GNAT family N-acetyltransferase [Salipaludibacillus sp. CUR1]